MRPMATKPDRLVVFDKRPPITKSNGNTKSGDY